MQLRRQEMKVYRGEDFTIDKVLKNKDGSPYVMSSALRNPYLLISVTDTVHLQKDNYVKRYWLSLNNIPRFKSTKVINLSDIVDEDGNRIYETFDKADPKQEEGMVGYYKDAWISIKAVDGKVDDAVFYNEGEGYKYYDNGWNKYEFRFVKRFPTSDTKNWISQNYLYSIQIVYGSYTVRQYLDEKASLHGITYNDDVNDDNYCTVDMLYDILIAEGVDIDDRVDVKAPIVVDGSIPVLRPTKINVIEYTQGGKLW